MSRLLLLFLFTSAFSEDIQSADLDETSSQQATDCPTWYISAEDGSGRCICGDTLNGEIHCQDKDEEILLMLGSCITYTDEQLLVSVCPYSPLLQEPRDDFYYPVPKNLSDVAEHMCSPLNRTGLFCSQCEEGLSLAALSYQGECVNCSNPTQGVILFLVLATVPTTIFFLLVMVCSIDVASGPMNAIILFINVAWTMINETPALFLFDKSFFHYLGLAVVTFYGIWNLDFLRYVIPAFCVSESLTPLQAKALEYVVAVYPLFLIFITYICVELYDSEYKIVVALWTPLGKVLKLKYFSNLNMKYSLIKAFATFLLLSYSKIFNISRALLDCTVAKNSSGVAVMRLLTLDASTPYFSSTHIPYMVLAIFMAVTFNLLPLFLLLLYPLKSFQLLLGKFSHINWHPLRAFMDIFQGCYKNGTDGTRDCRYFAGLNLLLRIVLLVPLGDNSMYLGLRVAVVLTVYVVLLALAKPYQRNILNYWEVFWYGFILVTAIWVLASSFSESRILILYYGPIIIHVYVTVVFVVKITKTFFPKHYNGIIENSRKLIEKAPFSGCCYLKEVRKFSMMEEGRVSPSETSEDYPDRVNRPQDYEPLLCKQEDLSVSGVTQFPAYRTYGLTASS